jgi:hypothetical protein
MRMVPLFSILHSASAQFCSVLFNKKPKKEGHAYYVCSLVQWGNKSKKSRHLAIKFLVSLLMRLWSVDVFHVLFWRIFLYYCTRPC